MSLDAGLIEVVLRLRDELTKQLDSAASSLDSFGSKAMKAGGALTAGLTLPIAAVGGASIKMAMDAVESENLFEVSFKGMAGAAREWSNETSKGLGLNQYELRKTSATLYTMFDSMGIGKDAAYGMSTSMVKLAADMASFYNLSPEEAFAKLRAGISGQTEPLMQLGINVQETTIQMTAMKHGLIKQGDEMTAQQKVMARYLTIMDATKNAQGDLARTLDSPTNQLRIMKERLNETAVALGMALMPTVQQFIGMLTSLLPHIENAVTWFSGLPEPVRQGAVVFAVLLAAIGPLLVALGAMAASVSAIIPLLPMIGTAIAALTGPIGLTVLAIGAIVTAFYKWDEIKKIAADVYDAIKSWFVDKLAALTAPVRQALQGVVGAFAWLKDTLVTHSVVPDTVNAIHQEFDRMGAGMDEKSQKAAAKVAANLKKISAELVEWRLESNFTNNLGVIQMKADAAALSLEGFLGTLQKLPAAYDNLPAPTGLFFDADLLRSKSMKAAQAAQESWLGVMGEIGQQVPNQLIPPPGHSVWGSMLGNMKEVLMGGGGAGGAAGGLVGLFTQAFTGGGGALGAVKGYATQATASLLGMIPMVGPFLSQFAGPLIAGIGRIGSALKNLFGGPSAKELAGREVVVEFEKTVNTMFAMIKDRVEPAQEQWQRNNIALREAYVKLGMDGPAAIAETSRMMTRLHEATKQGGAATQAVMDEMIDVLQRGLTPAAEATTAAVASGFEAAQAALIAFHRETGDDAAFQQMQNAMNAAASAGLTDFAFLFAMIDGWKANASTPIVIQGRIDWQGEVRNLPSQITSSGGNSVGSDWQLSGRTWEQARADFLRSNPGDEHRFVASMTDAHRIDEAQNNVPGRAYGSPGLGFEQFGSGRLMRLHGEEAVVRKDQAGAFAEKYGGSQAELMVALESMDRRMRNLDRRIGTAVEDAIVLSSRRRW